MNKLFCMGDCIVDFLPEAPGELAYTAKMGGAPANVCVAASKLGVPSYYLGKLADDNFGRFLFNELKKYGVKTDAVSVDANCKTGMVFVDLYDNGERDFFFYRDTPADANFYADEIDPDLFRAGDALHFCSIALMESPTKQAHKKALEYCKARGTTVSFDVNVRMHLWKDKDKLVTTVNEFLPFADIVKVTDDELNFLTDISDERNGITELFNRAESAKLIFVTKGEKGSSVYDRALNCFSAPAKAFKITDTTGAGDCFIASIIYKILNGEADLSVDGMKDAMTFAAKACALTISRKGAAPAMPTLDEISNLDI